MHMIDHVTWSGDGSGDGFGDKRDLWLWLWLDKIRSKDKLTTWWESEK
jgi:hypothetical protein